MTTKRPRPKTEASAATRAKPAGAPAPGLTRAHVKTLTEPEKNRLRAEALALVVKGQTATGTAALALSERDAARLRELLRCGMLPSDPPPPRPITRERDAELRELARRRYEARRTVGRFVPAWLNSEAEGERVKTHQADLKREAIAGTVAAERRAESSGGRKGGLTSGKNRIAKRGDCIENHRQRWEHLRKTMKARSAAKILERKTGFDFDSIARHFRTHPTA